MKRSLTLIICFLSIVLTAQTNFEIGTKWTYTWNDFGYHQPTYIEIVDDTIIDGMKWFRHEGVGGCAGGFKNVLIRESDSKVYMLNLVTNSENVLYDYTKTTGESWVIPIDQFVDYVINVDSVGTINLDGVEYNVQYIDNFDFGFAIIEGIGCMKYFFPQGNICDPHYGSIRCYSSDSLDIDFDPIHDCDDSYIVPPVSTKDVDENIIVNIFPNPVIESLNIENKSDVRIHQIDICTLDGRIAITQKVILENYRYEIDLKDLKSGVYLVKITTSQNEFINKIIKL